VDAQKTVETVGKMIVRQSKAMHDDRDARRAFDRYVLAVAAGRQAADLSEGQLRVPQRRVADLLCAAEDHEVLE